MNVRDRIAFRTPLVSFRWLHPWSCRAAFGDPFFTVWVRNDSATQLVVAITRDEGEGTVRYLADPRAVGATLSGGGDFHGRITVMDATSCTILGDLKKDGGVLVLVMPAIGAPEIVGYDDAFPDKAPEESLPTTTLCAATLSVMTGAS